MTDDLKNIPLGSNDVPSLTGERIDFSEKVRAERKGEALLGASETMLERHLQKCVQSLLAISQEEEWLEDRSDEQRGEYERNWLKAFEPLAPAEIPIDVQIKGDKVVLANSVSMDKALIDIKIKEESRVSSHYIGGDSEAFRELLLRDSSRMLNYMNTLMFNSFDHRLIDDLKDKLEGKVKEGRNGEYIFPKDAFLKALNGLMLENENALADMSARYGAPEKIDVNVLKASGQFRS